MLHSPTKHKKLVLENFNQFQQCYKIVHKANVDHLIIQHRRIVQYFSEYKNKNFDSGRKWQAGVWFNFERKRSRVFCGTLFIMVYNSSKQSIRTLSIWRNELSTMEDEKVNMDIVEQRKYL